MAWLGGESVAEGVTGGGRGRADCERRHAESRPAAPTRLASTGSRSRVSPMPTRTRSSARCAAGRTRAAGTSGAGARRCTSWRHGSTPTCISRWPARPTARWRWPASRASASSTTSTTVLTERRTTTRTPWAGRVIQAAREAGIRITLLDACYLHGGIGEELAGAQRRFGDGDADSWAARVGRARWRRRRPDRRGDPQRPRGRSRIGHGGGRVGDRAGAPLHAHVSEQPAENEACVAAYGCTPDRAARPSRRDRGSVHGRARNAPRPTPTSRCWAPAGAPAACVPRPSAISPTGSAGARAARRRHRARARLRLPRRHRSLRGGAGGRARRAAWRPGSAAAPPGELLEAATGAGHRCLGWPEPGGSSPGRSPTSSPSASTRRAWPGRLRSAPSARSSSRRPPPTSAA